MEGPWIAVTDLSWFDFLSERCDENGRLDEVNFWNPSGHKMRNLTPGDPVFFRLKSPRNAIAGYGFFAHFSKVKADAAWEFFGKKNGAVRLLDFMGLLTSLRRGQTSSQPTSYPLIGCTILRDAVFWPRAEWIPWGERMGWASSIVKGKTERDAGRASILRQTLVGYPPDDLVMDFNLLDLDERKTVLTPSTQRIGQGVFRTRILDAYGKRCAITGERTQPVLEAAHIQPYIGPRSNHIQNGLLLTQEFHTLFDRGYVTVTPSLEVRVSQRLREEWENGKRYYAYDGLGLASLPTEAGSKPSGDALEWHNEKVFKA